MKCNEPFEKKKTSRSQLNSWLLLGQINIKTNYFYVLTIHTMIQLLNRCIFTTSVFLQWQITARKKAFTKYAPTGNAAVKGRRQNYWMLIGQEEGGGATLPAQDWSSGCLATACTIEKFFCNCGVSFRDSWRGIYVEGIKGEEGKWRQEE